MRRQAQKHGPTTAKGPGWKNVHNESSNDGSLPRGSSCNLSRLWGSSTDAGTDINTENDTGIDTEIDIGTDTDTDIRTDINTDRCGTDVDIDAASWMST